MTEKNKPAREKTASGSGNETPAQPPAATPSAPAVPAMPAAMLVPEEPSGPGAKG